MKAFLKNIYRSLFPKNVRNTFKNIYYTNGFGKSVSHSGPGSDLEQTRTLVKELPVLLNNLNIMSLLDAPCGDFFWMQKIDLNGIKYIGWDIVEQIINQNIENFKNDKLRFECKDILIDTLPDVDLILCRDCLVHFSYREIKKVLTNLKSSKIKYLLTTTFTNRTKNANIITGEWRPINLQKPPFSFPIPLIILNENCTEKDGEYSDKSLGLWRISDIN
jgi:hypothetical protein